MGYMMTNVTDSDLFIKKRLEREYEKLMKQYFTFPYAILPNNSIKKISEIHGIKGMISHCGCDGVIDSMLLQNGHEIMKQMENLEFDYEFITNSLLKLSLSNYVWVDLYFPRPLTDDERDELENMLEQDVVDNYRLVDANHDEMMVIYNKIHDIQTEYQYKFNDCLGGDLYEPNNF